MDKDDDYCLVYVITFFSVTRLYNAEWQDDCKYVWGNDQDLSQHLPRKTDENHEHLNEGNIQAKIWMWPLLKTKQQC
jgi:hypothetical protein